MSKFHISKDGVARKCQAKSPETCKATTQDLKEHYSTIEAAQSAYELKQTFNTFKPLVKKNNNTFEEKAEHQQRMLEEARLSKRSLTGIELAERKEYVSEAISKMRNAPPSDENNYANASYGYYNYSDKRKKQQEEIIEEFMVQSNIAKNNGEIIFSGGLAGAGKSTIIKNYVEIDQKDYVSLSADDIKEIMAEKGMVPEVKGLTPMEASALIHEESLDLTDKIFEKLVSQRSNIIMDMTMNKAWSVTEKTEDIKHRGYNNIKAIFIDVDPKTSVKRAGQRYASGLNDYATNGKGLGGRYLPSSIIESQATQPGSKYRSKNAENIAQLTKMGVFTEKPLIFDNEGSQPTPISYEDFTKES